MGVEVRVTNSVYKAEFSNTSSAQYRTFTTFFQQQVSTAHPIPLPGNPGIWVPRSPQLG